VLSISYDNESLQDGAGAQLQRIIGVYAIAKFFRIPYIHKELSEVMVHPNDGVNGEEEYVQYLREINALVPFTNSRIVRAPDKILNVRHLGIKQFIKLLLRYRFSRKHIHISTLQPDHLILKFPSILRNFKSNNSFSIESNPFQISIHVRQSGTTPEFILKGEKGTRNLSPNFYSSELEKLRARISAETFSKFQIHIVTDEPLGQMQFKPFGSQDELWELAGYDIGDQGIHFSNGSTIEKLLREFPTAVIHRGGSPAEAIRILATGKYLIMSRSSLSVVAAILSRDSYVICPSDFWFHHSSKSYRKSN
jgi:hypothetical protein